MQIVWVGRVYVSVIKRVDHFIVECLTTRPCPKSLDSVTYWPIEVSPSPPHTLHVHTDGLHSPRGLWQQRQTLNIGFTYTPYIDHCFSALVPSCHTKAFYCCLGLDWLCVTLAGVNRTPANHTLFDKVQLTEQRQSLPFILD